MCQTKTELAEALVNTTIGLGLLARLAGGDEVVKEELELFPLSEKVDVSDVPLEVCLKLLHLGLFNFCDNLAFERQGDKVWLKLDSGEWDGEWGTEVWRD